MADDSIVTYSQIPWKTPGEYSNPIFGIVIKDIEPDYYPLKITSTGTATAKTFETYEGTIICPRCYEGADVEVEQWQP
jgi:hypothetical protein